MQKSQIVTNTNKGLSDQNTQAKGIKCSITRDGKKISFEINDQITTYNGQIQLPEYIDYGQIQNNFQKGNFEIISKTKSKIKIKMGFLLFEFKGLEYQQIQTLKKEVKQLKEKCAILQQTQWEQEDLNSTALFDISYMYRIQLNGSYTVICTYVDQNGLFYFYNNNTSYNTQRTNRKASTSGHIVNKIWKKKIQ